MPADLLETSAQLRAQLERQDAEALERLINAYTATIGRVSPFIDGLIERIEADDTNLGRSAAYRNLIAAIEDELEDYAAYLRIEVTQDAQRSAGQGLAGGSLLLAAAFASALGVEVADLPADVTTPAQPDALDFLAGYLDPEGELFKRINGMSGYYADYIGNNILARVAMGQNPRTIADWITDAYGMPLTDALRTTRTVQLYSYRQAENAQFVANSDVLDGVVWSAELDDRVCASCVALHGQVFPVGTLANDHHNGRCAMIPLVKGANNPIAQAGADWFASQPESRQRDLLGPGKYEAWKDGAFDFSALSQPYQDDVYGEMRREASLKELIGSE
jgi:hypothetical protein